MTVSTTPTTEQPIPLDQPMPHRKVLREWLMPLSGRTFVRAFVLLILDYAVFLALIAATVMRRRSSNRIAC